VLHAGDAVVDLGAWPGGWLQVADELVGAHGRVVGIDLVPLDPLPDARVLVLAADASDETLPERVREMLGRPADVVLSDMAPKLTGIAPRDTARAAELLEVAHRFAAATLRPGGALVEKTFGGAEMEIARAALRSAFGRVRLVGLDATRKGSSELYLIASDYRA